LRTSVGTTVSAGTQDVEGMTVQVDKREVAAVLRSRGDHDRAQQAECGLPKLVDTERDASLLHKFGLDVRDVVLEPAGDRDH
jgi:hypothetical protein